jgi:hypothetical protein
MAALMKKIVDARYIAAIAGFAGAFGHFVKGKLHQFR